MADIILMPKGMSVSEDGELSVSADYAILDSDSHVAASGSLAVPVRTNDWGQQIAYSMAAEIRLQENDPTLENVIIVTSSY